MKNIFIVPTDKPSRLWLSTRKENYLVFDKFPRAGVKYVAPQHTYITSDEQGFKGDWVIHIPTSKIIKVEESVRRADFKKIILTTDPQLIADGVRPIDDEFLEWFIKNPACEWVEIKKEMYMPFDGKVAFELSLDESLNTRPYYKIIIPQQKEVINVIQTKEDADIFSKELENPSEPNEKLKKAFKKKEILFEEVFGEEKKKGLKEFIDKHKQKLTDFKCNCMIFQPNCFTGKCRICGLFSKETLEEAAQKYGRSKTLNKTSHMLGFIAGTNWQANKIHLEIEEKWLEYHSITNNEDAWCFKEWLVEQFKKK